VFVQFGSAIPCTLNTTACREEFEVSKIRFDSPPVFEKSDTGMGVDTAVVEVDCMEECHGPIFWFPCRPIEEGTCCDGKDIIPFFRLSILGRAVGTHGFDFVAESRKCHIDEGM
jgi:hypothetical protein